MNILRTFAFLGKRALAVAFAAALAIAPAFADQSSLYAPTTGSLPGLTMVNDYNSAINAVNTCNSAASAPSNQLSGGPSAGNCWYNTSTGAVQYYDGTAWLTVGYIDATNHIWTPVVGGNAATSVASASTANLCGSSGAAPQGAYLTITGTTTITSFGSNCQVGQVKIVTFSGALTLTYNATSLVVPGAANIATAAGDVAVAVYLGSTNWKIAVYSTASGQPVAAATQLGIPFAVGLVVTNDGSTPNTKVDVTADFAQLASSSKVAVQRTSISITINDTINGAGGLDTGSVAASTWYYLYVIDNGTTTAGLMSLSATSPTLPGGYNYVMRVGATRTDGSSNLLRTIQKGAHARYQIVASTNTAALPVMISGTSGSITTPTWTAVLVSAYVPPTATAIDLLAAAGGGAGNGVIAAPNNAYGPLPSAAISNPPPLTATGYQVLSTASFTLESSSVYYASNNSNGALVAVGWVDKVNAS